MSGATHVEALLHLSALSLVVSIAYLGLDRVHIEKDVFLEALKNARVKAKKIVEQYELGKVTSADGPMFYRFPFLTKLKFYALCHIAEESVRMGWFRPLHICHRQKYAPLLRYFKARDRAKGDEKPKDRGEGGMRVVLSIDRSDDEMPKVVVLDVTTQPLVDPQASQTFPVEYLKREERRDRRYVSICAAVSATIFIYLTAAAIWELQYFPADADYLRWLSINEVMKLCFWLCIAILFWILFTVGLTHILENIDGACDRLGDSIHQRMRLLARDCIQAQLAANLPPPA